MARIASISGRLNTHLTITGVDRILTKLDNMSKAAQNLPLEEIGQYMVRSSVYRFQHQTQGKKDPQGNAWAKLAEITVKNRISQGYSPDDILVRSGNLVDSIHVSQLTSESVTVTANPKDSYGRSYANYHQSRLPRKKLPRRAFIGLSDENTRRILRIIRNHIRKTDAVVLSGGDE